MYFASYKTIYIARCVVRHGNRLIKIAKAQGRELCNSSTTVLDGHGAKG
jgi:hypothetical protein